MKILKYLADFYPEAIEQYSKNNTVSFYELGLYSNIKREWICEKDPEHVWWASPGNRFGTIKRGCPDCRAEKNKKIGQKWKEKRLLEVGSIEKTHPDLLKEWDYDKNIINPEEVSAGSQEFAWFKCLENPEHPSSLVTIQHKAGRKDGCSYCSNKKVNHTNCIATTHPHLLKEWNYEENGRRGIYPDQITFGSGKLVDWECPKGHNWRTPPAMRASKHNKTECPKCCKNFTSGHKEVTEWIKTFYDKKLLINDKRTIKNPRTGRFLELDIYFPDIFFAIEYNGERWHQEEDVKNRDKIKKQICEDKKIKLITVWENDWKKDKERIKENIKKTVDEMRKDYLV